MPIITNVVGSNLGQARYTQYSKEILLKLASNIITLISIFEQR